MTRAPYPGLRPFRPEEVDIFFGRERHVDQLLEKLAEGRFLGVVGPSGCGKSSLIGAGLIPALETGFLASVGARWRVAEMRPGDRPMERLADALLAESALGPERGHEPLARGLLLAGLRRGPLGLVEALAETPLPERTQLLLVVDQFEEIFRYHRHGDADQADAFVALLLATIDTVDVPVYVVLTMRSDFLGDCTLFRGLPEALNDSQFLTPRLDRAERRESILGPAGVFGAKAEPALVNRLLNDMGDEPDQLPLMQHVLMRLWHEAAASATKTQMGVHTALTSAGYDAVGGFANALSKHADEAFGELGEVQQGVAVRMFRCLTERGSGERDTRRPAQLGEVATVIGADTDQVAAVAEAFRRRDRSFLTPPEGVPLDESSVLDISHESLIRQWRRLSRWVDDEARSAETYRRLVDTARLWRQERAGLWGPPDLDLALDWKAREAPTAAWAERYGGDFDLAMEFLSESEEERVRNLAAADRAREEKERQRQVRQLSIVLGCGLALALGLALVAFLQWRKAEKLRDVAEIQRGRAESGFLVAQANAVRERVPVQSLLLAVAALADPSQSDVSDTSAAKAALLLSLDNIGGRPLVGHEDHVSALAMSPDGRWLASGSYDRTTRLWSLTDQDAESVILRGHTDVVRALAFTPDSGYLITAGDGRSVRLWDLADPAAEPVVLEGHTDSITALAVSPDGGRLLTGSEDHTARWWNLRKPSEPDVVLAGAQDVVGAVAISPDGRLLVVGSNDNSARVWSTADPAAGPRVLEGHQGAVRAAAFSPDSRWLATGSEDNTARLWSLDGNEATLVLRGHESSLGELVFSPDGRFLVTGSHDGTARLWDLERRDPGAASAAVFSGHRGRVSALAISPDGHWLVTGSWDKTARIWNLSAPQLAASSIALRGHGDAIQAVVISPDGEWLATGSSDNLIRMWPLTDANESSSSITLEGFRDTVSSLSYSRNGRWLATGSEDNTVRLWDLQLPNLAIQPILLEGHESSVNTVAIGPNDHWLASAGDDNTVRLWDLTSADRHRSITLKGHRSSINEVTFSSDGRWLASASEDRTARLWPLDAPDAPGGATEAIVLKGHRDSVTSVAMSPDGRWLATGSEDRDARLWGLSAEAGATSIVLSGHRDTVAAVAISSDSHFLVTVGEDHEARRWDLTAEDPAAESIVLSGHDDAIVSVAISADGRTLITGSRDNTARVWSLTDPAADPLVLRGPTADVLEVSISPDGKRAITGSADASVLLWDLTGDTPHIAAHLLGHSGPITALAISPSGSLVTGSTDKTARLWNFRGLWLKPLDELVQSACHTAGRNLSRQEWNYHLPGRPYQEMCPGLPIPGDEDTEGVSR